MERPGEQQDKQPQEEAPLSVQQQKQQYFTIFFALVVSVGIYGFLCFLLDQNRKPMPEPAAALSLVVGALALASLVAAVGWLHFRTYGKAGDAPSPATMAPPALMKPGEFQTETIIALALAESCAILGLLLFFLGAPLKAFVPFAAGTLAVDLFYILPRAVRYWSAYEKQRQSGQASSTPGPFEL
ncbi:MAG TPA: hypothetical protein VNA16_04930 [Abditibacteriaceae bacterium]|nr:hypothetical protein [Abditibacteriaceae bacterium]